jgi:outer membrane protein OmpA-like peptidoglycan-associated protein
VTSQFLHNLESMVAAARDAQAEDKSKTRSDAKPPEIAGSASAAAPATPAGRSPPSPAPQQQQQLAERAPVAKPAPPPAAEPPASSASPAPSSRTAQVSIPIPVLFVYNEASFTPEGRRAAQLLLDYLLLKKFDTVTFTGHADERGSDPYNMDLSRERLEAVGRFLREGGYKGKLVMIPKGKTEPFMGVDRSKFPLDALYQLDRRVELHVTP